MALSFIWNLQNFWPFSRRKLDGLKVSDDLVRKLPIPDHTKQFVFAIREPESQSVVYILSAQSLSERSASDAECLIKSLRPDAVVAQVGHVGANEVEAEEHGFDDQVYDPVPTSAFAVLKRCFVDKVNKEKYESAAGNFVLREIFGISFHGNFFAAKKAAEEVGSSFLMLQSPFVKYSMEDASSGEIDGGNSFGGLISSLAPQRVGSMVSSSLRRFSLTDVQAQMVKIVSSYMNISALDTNSGSNLGSVAVLPESGYEPPPFAQSIYPLLEDLHSLFKDIPCMGRALAHAQKMLFHVNRGEVVDSRVVSEVCSFRVAVEGLRIALNSTGRLPSIKIGSSGISEKVEFSELPFEDKAQVLFAQALRGQARKFKTTVAVVDASALAGLRKHWNTPVPKEVKDLVGQIVMSAEDDGESLSHKKQLLYSSPVVAVGAGATAAFGVSSLSKVVPASTYLKFMTFNFSAPLKIFFSQTHKVITLALGKSIGPSKLAAPGLASSVGKSSALKAVLSAEKIRAVTHGVIASAEKTSISAMRTSFYQIMRKRQARPIRALPWATFGCSFVTCAGLLVYGDGIECAAESLPSAPSIASLGRGIQSLHKASQAVRQTESGRIQKSIESLMYRLKKVKIQ
ncbi:uncharacterized protein LOC116188613 [Punica granatum]|uniref:Uncharacterized protein LOC116188613 n=1 Tax=Punica granatum TaxID=22663 RepID=A0A218XZY8_PUNGR|nr:uncharacterized protein LOC116188613 [Punica granatum]OWM90206.1 hypothetical protein CDL15_Pgr006527 [Punica granatum]